MLNFSQFGNDLYTGKRSYDIIGRRKLWYFGSLAVILVMLSVTLVQGVNLGIEFRGGSEFRVSGVANTSDEIGREIVADEVGGPEPKITVLGSDTMLIQTDRLEASQTESLRAALAEGYSASPSDVTSSFIGPTWGQDVTEKALRALVVFVALVSVVMAVYFRNWKSSLAGVAALLHDLVLTAGVYGAVGFEVTPAAVIGFLTILGYSLYDTVVVFDKVRENTVHLQDQSRKSYQELVNQAVNQTLVRSINTSVVAILPVAGILFIGAFVLGAGTLKDIALALFIGIIAGAYSSVFIAPPLLVELRRREPGIIEQEEKVRQAREERAAEIDADGADLVGTSVPTASGPSGQRPQPRGKRTGRPSGKKKH